MVRKLKAALFRKWSYSDHVEIPFMHSKNMFSVSWPFAIYQNPRVYTARTENSGSFSDSDTKSTNDDKKTLLRKRSRNSIPKAAQDALLDYFVSTRNLQFSDAETISLNAPQFIGDILKKIDTKSDIGASMSRFFCYYPINEFEPFFESVGLSPREYSPLLPRDLMFLSDDVLLLKNCNVLCNHGIARNKIGKIYRDAVEVFRYGHGVLQSKFKGYEELGFEKSFMSKVIVCCPTLLIGDANKKFVEVIEVLKTIGSESWVLDQLPENSSYNWSMILEFLSLLKENGFSNEELYGLISQHPGLIFESSGDVTFALVVLQVKFGFSMIEACSLFRKFPEIEVKTFAFNYRRCIQFFQDIEMSADEIQKIARSHRVLLGTCTLKKTESLLSTLNVGKKRLCNFIQENPSEIRKMTLRSKTEPLPCSGDELKSKMMKTKFLVDLGYKENSDSMNKAIRMFRGKGSQLQERFDCLVKAGLDRKDVCEMVKTSPLILNQTEDTLQMKIDVLVNELGYPISSLVAFPSYLNFTCERIKLRLSMYDWLKAKGKADPMLALSTIVTTSEKIFISQYVNRHPKGPQVWKELKNQICPD